MSNQASLPAPRTWSGGDYVTVPRLRADVVNAIAFLRQRPVFVGQDSGAPIASGSDASIPLAIELLDSWNGHVTTSGNGANNSQYWCQVPGWYLVRSAPSWNYTSTTAAGFSGSMSGVTNGTAWGPVRGPLFLAGSGFQPTTQAVHLVQLVNTSAPGQGGDWVNFQGIQQSGSTVSLSTAAVQLTTCSARWVCAPTGTEPLAVPPLASVPSPITHAWLNSNVRDTIEQLIYPPVCKAVYSNNSSSLASTTFPASSLVPLNSTSVDTYGGFNTSTHQYTVPVSGRYYIYGQFSLNGSTATTGYGCGISINGGTTMWGDVLYFNPAGTSQSGGAAFARRVRLTAGQTVQLMANQGSGSSILYQGSGSNPTHMIIIWEGI